MSADLLALLTVIFWPLIPLFWIPVHGLSRFFKKLGLLTFVFPLVTWMPLAYVIYLNRIFLLHDKIDLPFVLNIIGLISFISGAFLHIWTFRLLGWGIVGLPEISTLKKGVFVKKGPFSRMRHPTYFAHTLMFSGIFFITGSIAVGIVTLVDFIVVHSIIIPLEDRELVDRFGDEYERYKKNVPGFFPRIRS